MPPYLISGNGGGKIIMGLQPFGGGGKMDGAVLEKNTPLHRIYREKEMPGLHMNSYRGGRAKSLEVGAWGVKKASGIFSELRK